VSRDDGFGRENFFAKEFLRSVDERWLFQFASVMHLIVDRLALVRMVETGAPQVSVGPHDLHPKATVTLEGNETSWRDERLQMLPDGFSFKASAPEAFHIVTPDAWLTPKEPSAMPNDTQRPTSTRRRRW